MREKRLFVSGWQFFVFFFQAEDGIRDLTVTGVQTCALPIFSEFGEMVGAGAVAVSDDGKPVVSSHLMRTALEYARTFEIPVADHCEEPTLAAGGVMHEGLVAARLGLKGIPAAAEEDRKSVV